MKRFVFSRRRRNRQASDVTDEHQATHSPLPTTAQDRTDLAKVTLKDANGYDYEIEGNHLTVSPKTIVSGACDSERKKQPPNPKTETGDKKRGQLKKLETAIFSPRRKALMRKENKKGTPVVSSTHGETTPKQLTQDSIHASSARPVNSEDNGVKTTFYRTTCEAARCSSHTLKLDDSTSSKILRGTMPRFRRSGSFDSRLNMTWKDLGDASKRCGTFHGTSSRRPVTDQMLSASVLSGDNGTKHNPQNRSQTWSEKLDDETPALSPANSQVLHVSMAYDDGNPDIRSAPASDEIGRDKCYGMEAHESETPSVTGSWARATGEGFLGRLKTRQVLEKEAVEKDVRVHSLRQTRIDDTVWRLRECGRYRTQGSAKEKREFECQNSRPPLQLLSVRSFGHTRTKKKGSDDNDLESPWGVKGQFDSGESFDAEQEAKSIRASLNTIATRINAGRTRKGSKRTASPGNFAESLDASADEESEEGSDENDGNAEGGKIEMFRDAFVEYTLRSMHGNNKTFANRLEAGRRSTLAIFKA